MIPRKNAEAVGQTYSVFQYGGSFRLYYSRRDFGNGGKACVGEEIPDELIQSTKTALMGPFAGMGDSLIGKITCALFYVRLPWDYPHPQAVLLPDR